MTRTARMVASLRASASSRPEALCEDSWADAFAGREGHDDAAALLELYPPLERFVALRTAFLDREVERAIESGVEQVVILGAGYDTRAARFGREGVLFFEVDQPATQEEKRRVASEIGGYPEGAARYVPYDFESQAGVVQALCRHGFSRNQPAMVIWEGVVYYLTETAVRSTLETLARNLHPDSRLFFDYIHARFVRGERGDADDHAVRREVASMGEPLRFGVSDLVELLFEHGFRFARSTSFAEICLEWTGAYDPREKLRFQAIAEARGRAP